MKARCPSATPNQSRKSLAGRDAPTDKKSNSTESELPDGSCASHAGPAQDQPIGHLRNHGGPQRTVPG
jgi:hypothetical protein